ncbi:hypothetical protein EC396_08910 [Lutibacter sp. HS1-25]|uniref:RteC domain-containing protein n=1 Tax=Lutibacter sp. HS1-25 TaxID=2485000 RepID=UPI0010118368|nr:RteC domain-containing protein [Lutibacter sp. HS1-25]RXP54822.1 hypothetical protein EC396_08910 [Lutibacter sp. HS1-25]
MPKIASIISKLDASIIEIDKSNHNQLISLNLKIKLNENCLNELRQEVKLNGFQSPKEEIYFFKKQKPYIKGRLRFYLALNAYLIEKPAGSKSKQRKYVDLQLSYIRLENCKYINFVNYYKLNETKNDKTYFLRGIDQFELYIDNSTIFEDPEFRTTRDHLASEIVANDLLTQYYTNELELLKDKNAKPSIQEVQNTYSTKIPWTGTPTELIELLRSLNACKSIDNGNLSTKQLKELCINHFGIDPGNIYKILDQISARKTNHTKFLDKLKKSLLNDLRKYWKKL